MRALTVLAAAVATVLLGSSCGGESGDPRALGGPAREAVQLVGEFRDALAGRDFERICDVLLARELRRQAGGKDCPDLLKRTAADVRGPAITVETLTIKRHQVTAEVTTTTAGQPPVPDTMELVRQRGRLRIRSLSERSLSGS